MFRLEIYAAGDVMPRHQGLPLESIEAEHMQACGHIRTWAGTAILLKGTKFKILKCRDGEGEGDIRDTAALYRFVEERTTVGFKPQVLVPECNSLIRITELKKGALERDGAGDAKVGKCYILQCSGVGTDELGKAFVDLNLKSVQVTSYGDVYIQPGGGGA